MPGLWGAHAISCLPPPVQCTAAAVSTESVGASNVVSPLLPWRDLEESGGAESESGLEVPESR